MLDHQVPGPAHGAGTAVFLPAMTHSYLARAALALREAMAGADAAERYALAHVSALRATAALLAARTGSPGARGRAPRNAWVLLEQVAPEFGQWAAHFAAGAGKRAAAEAGARHAVTEAEAEELIGEADQFLALVEISLGLTEHLPIRVA